MKKNENDVFYLEEDDVKELIPIRQRETHKYDYGNVLVIAGSSTIPGTGALCANASAKMGAGTVELISPRVHSATYPEIIIKEIITTMGVFASTHIKMLQKKLFRADAIVIGPGMSKNNTISLIRELVLNNLEKNWIIDGDGINAFNSEDKLTKNVILTPHLEEFARLNKIIKVPINELTKPELYDFVKETANVMDCNILLKGPTTFITDSKTQYFDEFGNPGMATAGSGDVLSGIIAANIAKRNKNIFDMDFLKTVALSSLMHSLSADYYVKYNDMETLIATDIIDNIKNIIKEYNKENKN